MSQTLTISAPLAMAAVPGLIAIGGVVVGIALNGWLSTGIEVARLNASNDDRTARWLWLRGYRKTPHAGPDITPELPADDAVTGEVLAIDGVDTETDAPHDDTDRPRWWASVVAFVVLAPIAFARRQLPALAAWWRRRRDERYLIGSGEQATDVDPFAELLAHATSQPPTNPTYKSHRCPHDTVADRDPGYQSRHTAAGYETGIFPVINVPTQRSGDADA